jgi:hypothetical protein
MGLPPGVRKTLRNYLTAFLAWLQYKIDKSNLPLCLYFHSLNPNALYFLKGQLIRFTSIAFASLEINVHYLINEVSHFVRVDQVETEMAKTAGLFSPH